MDELNWIEPRTITHEVAGTELEFREVTVHQFAKLRDIARMSLDSVMQLMRSARDDAGSMDVYDQENDGHFKSEKTALSVSPELARHHEEKRTTAINQLTEVLMGSKHQASLAGLICDSLNIEGLTPDKMVKQAGGGVFVECLTGTLKANARIFGPFAPMVEKMLKKAESEETANSLEETISSLPGKLSPTLSPTSPAEASTPTI